MAVRSSAWPLGDAASLPSLGVGPRPPGLRCGRLSQPLHSPRTGRQRRGQAAGHGLGDDVAAYLAEDWKGEHVTASVDCGKLSVRDIAQQPNPIAEQDSLTGASVSRPATKSDRPSLLAQQAYRLAK